MKNRKVVILGIDGVSWNILEKNFEWGAMPYLKHLVGSGKVKRGYLHSTMPPMTPPAWTSIATGVNPGKHGVYGFHRVIKREGYFEFYLMRPYDVGYPRIHEMLYMHGLKSITINIPLTYPPWETICRECIIVNDWMAPELRIYPKKLESKFKDYFAKGMEGHVLKSRSEESLKMIAERAYHFADGVYELMNTIEDWNLLFVVFSEPDWVMHFNPDFVGGKRAGISAKVFSAIDGFLKKIHGEVDDIILVSDHGFTVCDELINIPYYLKKLGLARRLLQEETIVKVKGLTLPSWLVSFIKRHEGLKKLLLKTASKLVKKPVSIEHAVNQIPYSEARALMPEVGAIYAALGYETEVLEALKKIPGIKTILEREEVYWGYHVDTAPDYVLMPEKPYCMYSRTDKPTIKYDTNHHPIGIVGLLSNNENIWWKDTWNTWDIVPLTLTLLGLPVPHDTDGYHANNVRRYNYYARWKIAKRAKRISKP